MRGIRLHFAKMLKSIKEDSVEKAQLGLGHSYSRAKVKFNVHRADNMIIQVQCLQWNGTALMGTSKCARSLSP